LIQVNVNGQEDSINFETYVTNALGGYPDGGYVEINGERIAKTDWAANSWYTVKIVLDVGTGDLGLKIWQSAGVEPESFLLTYEGSSWTGPGNPGTGEVELQTTIDTLAGGSDIYGQTVDFDYFSAAWDGSSGCADGFPPVPKFPAADPTGRACEVPTRISATRYRTSTSYIPFSTLVWRNGLLQRRLVDYVEDPTTDIVFDESIGATESIRICYYIGVNT
jgi:hypothetical protein